MFGKKKSADSSAPSPSGSSKSKSKRSSAKIKRVTAKGAPNVFVQHFEKMLLGLIVGLCGFLFYRSLTTETLPSNRTPEALSRQAQELLNKVKTENHWDQILPNVQQYTRHQFHTDAKAARTPVEATAYATGRFEPPTVRELYGKRSDPEIFPPMEVHVRNVFGALATAEKMTDANRKDPFDQYLDAPPVGKKVVKPKTNRNPRPGEEGVEPTTPTNIRVLKAQYDLGVQIGLGAGAIDPSGTGGRMGGGLGGRIGGSFGGNNASGDGGLNDTQGPSYRLGTRPVSFNVITALIPHAKHVEEFQRAIFSSGTYLPGRDYPTYLNFEIQRADVTGTKTQEVPEDQWKTIISYKDMLALPQKWNWATQSTEGRLAPPVPDVIDPRAVLPGLTTAIPPMLIRDYRDFAKHPKIDWSWNPRVVRSVGKRPKKPQQEDDHDIIAGSESASAGSEGSGSFGFGRQPGMDDGMPGMDAGMSGMDSAGSAGGFGFGRGMGEGMSDYGGAGIGAESGSQTPEFKMVRAYDFLDAKSRGRSFRYRMRIAMRDPNYPENQDYADQTENRNRPAFYPAPTPDQLEGEVLERVALLRQKEDKEIEVAKKDNKFKARSLLYTQWSQPSQPVFVTQPVEFFVGDIDTKGAKAVVTQMVASPPSVVLAAELEGLQRGAVLGSIKAERDFVVPTTKIVKRVEAAVAPGAILIDYRGGVPLAGDRKDDPMTSNVEAMALRSDGSIAFSNSLDDQMLYRMYSFKDEKESAEATPVGDSGSAGSGQGR